MTKTITIPEEVKNKVQRADIERCARRDIIAFILENNNDINIDNERFQNYQKEYSEKFNNFEVLKSEIEKEYVKPNIGNYQAIRWNLDYNTNEITITIKD